MSVASSAFRVAKDALRAEIKKKIAAMSKEERAIQSKAIADKLINNERYKVSNRISIYLSTDTEVSTEPIIQHIFKSGKECFIPKYNEETQFMDMVRLRTIEELKKFPRTKWGIKQPAAAEQFREEALSTGGLDLMVVPGLAFTKRGIRLGKGKGYYDIYVERCLHDPSGRPYTIGLAFSDQILPSIPADEHDFIVDEVVYVEK